MEMGVANEDHEALEFWSLNHKYMEISQSSRIRTFRNSKAWKLENSKISEFENLQIRKCSYI